MTIETALQYENSNLPPELVLFSIKILDSIPILSGFWRKLVPFGWADPPNGFLSFVHSARFSFPHLKEYHEVPGGLFTFFSTSDTALGDITSPTGFSMMVLVALSIRKVKFALISLVTPIVTKAALNVYGNDWVLNNKERIYKCSEYTFRLCYHSLITVYGFILFKNNDWWLPSKGGTLNFWYGYPNQVLNPDMIWYCLIQGAYNFDALISICLISFKMKFDMRKFPFVTIGWADTVRGDFPEMFIHHIMTNALCFGVSRFRMTRPQIAVLIVHDLSDIPVDLSKMAHFLRMKMATIFFFFLMNVLWIITRLWILPFIIYKSIIYESVIMVIEKGLHPEIYFTFYPMFIGLMGGLCILHYAWFLMFMRMAHVLMSKGEAHDLSEHKNGEKSNTNGEPAIVPSGKKDE